MVGLGSVQRAKAQSIMGATQVQQNSIHYYTTDYFCDLMLYTINWGVSGGIILQNQGINGILVKWTSTAGQVFMTANSACCNEYNPCSASLEMEIQVPNSPITISGLILDQNGQGASGVSVSNGSTSTSTNSNGEYSFTVPYGWTGSISATPPACNGISITSLGYNNLTVSVVNQNFNLTPPFQISYSQTSYTIQRMHQNIGTWRYVITFMDGTISNFDDCNNNFIQRDVNKAISQICVNTCSGSCSQCN
jgi:hypothetical protein